LQTCCSFRSTLRILAAVGAASAVASAASGQVKSEPVMTGPKAPAVAPKMPAPQTANEFAQPSKHVAAEATGARAQFDKSRPMFGAPSMNPRGVTFVDSCGSAPVVGYGSFDYDITTFTNDYAGICGATGTAPDGWVAFLAPASETVFVETCFTANHDSVLSVITACGGATIVCNDDFCQGLRSSVSFAATAGTTYRVRIAGFAGGTGSGQVWIGNTNQPPPPPPVCADCPPGGIAENEADCGVPVDSVNGGCNSSPPVFSPISVGQTVCGTGAFDGFTRDTDWYELNLATDTEVTWTVNAEFDLLIGTISSPCPQGSFRVFSTAPACGGPISVTECLAAGTYYLFVAPQFTTSVACGPARYVATLTGVACTPPPAPPNDNCADATPVGEGTFPYCNVNATQDGLSPCAGLGSDVWFLYTATQTAVMTITTCSDLRTHDTVMAVYDAPCGGAQLGCNDDGPPFCAAPGAPFSGSTVTIAATAGSSYLVQIGSFGNGAQGCGELTIMLAPPPPVCADCPPGGIPENEPNCGLPDTVNGGCNSSPPVFSPISVGQTVCGTGAFDGFTRDTDWYELVLSSATEVTWTVNAEFDLLIGTINSPCPQGSFRVFATAPSCGGPISVTECLAAGTYYLFVAPQFTETVVCGPARYVATLTGVSCTPPPPPPNDNCASATAVGEGTFPYCNVNATQDGPSPCAGLGPDVWFLYTATVTDAVTITTCSDIRTHDTVMAVYDAPCGAGALINCNDDGPPFCAAPGAPFSGSTVTINAVAGNQYLVQIGSFAGGAQGCGELTIMTAPPPPVCADCPPGGIPENEPNCGLPDTVNGGCNSTPPVFSPIALNQTVCGTGAFDGATRDTDWYRFTLAGPTEVTWTANAEFDFIIGFVAQPCPQGSFIAFSQATACAGPATVTQTLGAGDWVAFIAPQFTNTVACGDARYVATLSGNANGACCIAGACSVTSQANCTAQGGTYLGDNTTCPAFAYTESTCTNAFEDIAVTGTPGCVGDDCATLVPLGFSFTFYGNSFTDIRVGSNGYMTFGLNGTTFTNAPIPSTGEPNNLVAPLWDDWRTDICAGGAQIDTQTLGTAPNRRFIAQWTTICHFSNNGQRATFQAILFEGSNAIEYRYNVWALNSPSIGVENADGSVGTSINPATVAQVDCRRLVGSVVGQDPCACPCDWNFDGVVNSQDFFDFLNAFFQGNADFNHDGVTNSQDFFDFLNCFFEGC
jgi:uncharacterized membrane protein (DUF441 family)